MRSQSRKQHRSRHHYFKLNFEFIVLSGVENRLFFYYKNLDFILIFFWVQLQSFQLCLQSIHPKLQSTISYLKSQTDKQADGQRL